MSSELHREAEAARALAEWDGRDQPGAVRVSIAQADANVAYALAYLDREYGPAVCGVSVNEQRADLERELNQAHIALRNALNAVDALKARVDRAEALRR